ncbi:MAG TPA: DUF1624 domain-containing protein [Sulfurimonas sp.]|nr:DUF1624 domain-containing protein [Sulfurimonas sp.]
MNKRYFELDFLRGFATLLMIIFHFSYDLAYFGYADYQTTVDFEWRAFRSLILSTFLLVLGMSIYAAYSHSIDWKKVFKRSVKLFIISLIISIGSYIVFEHSWIYFGVIHFILVASLFSLAFLRWPNLALFIGIGFLLTYYLGYFHFDPVLGVFIQNFGFPSHTEDVVSFTPWFGIVLIGIFLMHHQLFSFKVKEIRFTKSISRVGQHSLMIYLIHQPIFFGVFELISWIRRTV